MTARKDHVRVTVVAPGPNDGPNWQHMVRGPGVRAKRFSSGTTDLEEAWRRAREREARMNARLAPRRGEDPLAILVLDRHVAFRETDRLTAPNTLSSYHDARRALAPALGDTRASGLARDALESVQQHLLNRERPLKPSTANLYMDKLQTAWEWAHGKRHPSVGPWPGVGRLPVERTPKRQYRPHELEAVLLEAARYGRDGRLVPLLCLLAEIGPRIGEALALRGRDVDRVAGTVTLYTPKTARRGGVRSRTVAVSEDVLAMLPRRKPEEWVFRSITDPEKPMPYGTVQRSLATIRRRAGLGGEPLDLHSFRRYAIRRMHSAGVPLADAKDFFGHLSTAAHMVYMTDVATPAQQRALIARARGVHDPMAALPGRVTTSGVPVRGRKLMSATGAALGCWKGDVRPLSGQVSHAPPAHHIGSREDRSPSSVLHLSRDARAAALARLLCDLAPSNRALVLAAVQDVDGLGAGAIATARECWPDLVVPAPVKKGAKRRAAH